MMEMGLLVGLFTMFFWTPYCMCKGIWIITYDGISTGEKVKCMIPIYNMLVAEKTYTGRVPLIFISNITTIVLFLIRVIEVLAGAPEVLAMITVVLLTVAFLAGYIFNVIFVFCVMKDADVTGMVAVIVFSVAYPIGQYYVGNILPKVLKNALKEEKTFL